MWSNSGDLFLDAEIDIQGILKPSAIELNEDSAKPVLTDFRVFRSLHQEMDQAVSAAYGWDDLNLEYGFHEVDFLPENDRVRYTISPKARKQVLRRPLKLNHQRHAEEPMAEEAA